MGDGDLIRIKLVNFWEEEQIVELYRSEGWWKDFKLSSDQFRLRERDLLIRHHERFSAGSQR